MRSLLAGILVLSHWAAFSCQLCLLSSSLWRMGLREGKSGRRSVERGGNLVCLDSVAYGLRQVDSFSTYKTGGDAYCAGECSSISVFDDGSWGASVGALALLQCLWAPVRVTKVQATLRFMVQWSSAYKQLHWQEEFRKQSMILCYCDIICVSEMLFNLQIACISVMLSPAFWSSLSQGIDPFYRWRNLAKMDCCPRSHR